MAEELDVIGAAAARESAIVDRLAGAPVVDVLGVIDASGAGGCMSRGEAQWTLRFWLDGWRIAGGDVHTTRLHIRQKVTETQLKACMKSLTPYTVVRIHAHVLNDAQLGGPQALVEEILGLDSMDAELLQRAGELQKPVTRQDSVFGTLTLDRRFGWYTADTSWNGARIELQVSTDDGGDLTPALQAAHSLWQDQSAWNARIQDFAVAELLALKNDGWLDEVEVTADQFRDRMRLEAVNVRADGSFDFWHDDGDLFWGHAIQISGSLSEGPTRADIPG